jgi:hypothetical protein
MKVSKAFGFFNTLVHEKVFPINTFIFYSGMLLSARPCCDLTK